MKINLVTLEICSKDMKIEKKLEISFEDLQTVDQF